MLVTEPDLALDVGRHLDAVGAKWCIGGASIVQRDPSGDDDQD